MRRILLSILVAAGLSHGAGIVWNAADSANDTKWSNDANWSGGTKPGTADTAIFDATGGTKAPTIDVSPSVAQVRIAATYNRAWSLSGQTLTCGQGFSDDGVTGAHNYGNGITCNGASATFHVGSGVGTVTATACSLSLNGTTGMVLDDDKGIQIKTLSIGASAVVTHSGASAGGIVGNTGIVLYMGNSSTLTLSQLLLAYSTATSTALSLGASTAINGTGQLSVYAVGVTLTLPPLILTGTNVVYFTNSGVNNSTFNLSTFANSANQTRMFRSGATNKTTFNTRDSSITCGAFHIGSNNATGSAVYNFGASSISVGSFVGSTYVLGTDSVNMSTSKWTCGGSWTWGSNSTVGAGTSRVVFANTAKATITSANKAFYDVIDSATTGQIDSLEDSLTAHDFIIKSGKAKGLSNTFNLSGNFTWANTCSDTIFARMALHRWTFTGASPTLTLQGTGKRLLDSAQWVPKHSLYVVMDSNNTIKSFSPVRDTAPQVWTMQASRTLTVLAAADSSLSGTPTRYDTLRSSTPGTPATIAIPNVKRDSYLYVKDVTLTGFTDTCTSCVDGGGNTGWYFPPTCSTTTLIRAPTQTATVGVAITPMVHSWTGQTPDSIKVRTTLPAGLSAHPATGTISGTATDTTSMMGIMVVGYACSDSSVIYDSLRVGAVPVIVGVSRVDTIGQSGSWGHAVTWVPDSVVRIGTWPDSSALATGDTVAFHWLAKRAQAVYQWRAYGGGGSDTAWDTITIAGPTLAYAGNPLSVPVGSAITAQEPTSVLLTDSITGTVPHGLTLTKTGATMGRIAGTPDTIGAFAPWLYSWYANAKADSVRFVFSIRDTAAVSTASGGLPYRSAAYRTEYRGRAYRGSVFR